MSNNYRVVERKRCELISSINITPFVDIMLVLLVVFMISSPEIMPSFLVDLPKADKAATVDAEEPIILTINKDGEIYVNDKLVKPDNLMDELIILAKGSKESHLFIRGDERSDYGMVIQLINQVNSYGFKRVALVTKTDA